jgi:alcohol dehydrogenase (cytochrome c)
VALDADTLEEVRRFSAGAGVNAPPMTFSVDGKQYVAILVGLGGAWPERFVDSAKRIENIRPSSLLCVFAL